MSIQSDNCVQCTFPCDGVYLVVDGKRVCASCLSFNQAIQEAERRFPIFPIGDVDSLLDEAIVERLMDVHNQLQEVLCMLGAGAGAIAGRDALKAELRRLAATGDTPGDHYREAFRAAARLAVAAMPPPF